MFILKILHNNAHLINDDYSLDWIDIGRQCSLARGTNNEDTNATNTNYSSLLKTTRIYLSPQTSVR